jgi:hypothetical protein
MKKYIKILMVFFVLAVSFNAKAQLDSTMLMCLSKMDMPYISDGQTYTALLNGDEIAEFHATFYGESTYRIVSYAGNIDGNIIFSLYDKEHNLLFTNKDYENVPYWNFEFDYTLDCIIEAQLDTKNIPSGIAVLLIGFKQ